MAKRKNEVREFRIGGLPIFLTKVHNARLEKLAESADMNVLDYVKEILEKTTLPEQHTDLEKEAQIYIKLYEFCLKDCIAVEKIKAKR